MAKKSKLTNFILIFIIVILAGTIGYLLRSYQVAQSQKPVSLKEGSYCSQNISKASGLYPVSEVIDGDTIQVKINGKRELVRLLGINTPEVENKYRHQECFGPEASKETKKLLSGKKVYLLPDPQAPDRGKYNRLLRYVFLPNGDFINADLVRDGYAFEYIYQPFQFMKYFAELQQQAKAQKKGLWSNKCDYNTQ